MTHSICLVDGSGYIFRAFYALPALTRADGTPVGALVGFANMLLPLLQKNGCPFVGVVFDAARENFRNALYPAYKENRQETPPELIPQFALIRQLLDAFNVKWVEKKGYEADDLIASYTQKALHEGWQVRVISSDKDLMQLMRPGVSLYDPMKHKDLTADSCLEKFGVLPEQVVAVQALMGDSTDNIPGAKGVGPKTAAALINRFGTLENLFDHLSDIEKPKLRQALQEGKENVLISEKLARLDADVPNLLPLEEFQKPVLDMPKIKRFLQENGLNSLLQRMERNFVFDTSSSTEKTPEEKVPVKILTVPDAVRHFLQKACQQKELFFFFKEKKEKKEVVGQSVLLAIGREFAEVVLKNQADASDLFGGGADGLTFAEIKGLLKPIFEDKGIKKTGCQIKTHLHFLFNYQDKIAPVFLHDINVMHFTLYGEECVVPTEESGDILTFLCAQEKQLSAALQENTDSKNIYFNLEAPLIPVLFQMEQAGVLVDQQKLQELTRLFQTQMHALTQKAYALAGREFNVNAPGQLAEILGEQNLGLTKKTASGTLKTDSKILENLAEQGNPLAKTMLEYRQIAKLKSTYADTLLQVAGQNKGRVHTTYLQTSVNTGRLSSANPNLQNIPIRTEEGKKIRSAFIAREGYVLVAGDYSQIELRLMASIAHVKELMKAFENKADIHAQTASQVFGVPLDQVDGDLRRQAKAVNFGIIYGISAFGLAQNLGISRTQANAYIQAYFDRYPEIKVYMDTISKQAKEKGFVKSLFGRTCFIKGFDKPATAGYAARAAINAPMQASGADIIKMVMIRVAEKLLPAFEDVKMLLQVHDELVFEVPEKQAESFGVALKELMEKVPGQLPLTAEIGIGKNWKDAH